MADVSLETGESVEWMLTTTDNPYDPFSQWDEWFAWDEGKGYHTSGLLARFVALSPDQSEADAVYTIHQAIDRVIEENIFGVHKKVSKT